MKKLLIVLAVLSLSGCMSAAQQAKEQERVNAIVRNMTPEQRSQLEMQLLAHQAGLDSPTYHETCYQVGNSYHCDSY